MKELTNWQKKEIEIAAQYAKMSLQEKMDVIAHVFNYETGKIKTTPCRGKWRGTSDISIRFDNDASLYIGNYATRKSNTQKAWSESVDIALRRFNPEIVQAAKESAAAVLLKQEIIDNAIAAQRALKPYTFLNVELNDREEKMNGGYMGWYYVTLAVGGKIVTHLEGGLFYGIAEGRMSEIVPQKQYFTAGGLNENSVDYVFYNVGFSSASDSYSLTLRDDVLERAEKRLAEREKECAGIEAYALRRKAQQVQKKQRPAIQHEER